METEIHKANEAQQHEFEQKVMKTLQESLELQQKSIQDREEHIITLERDMFERYITIEY